MYTCSYSTNRNTHQVFSSPLCCSCANGQCVGGLVYIAFVRLVWPRTCLQFFLLAIRLVDGCHDGGPRQAPLVDPGAPPSCWCWCWFLQVYPAPMSSAHKSPKCAIRGLNLGVKKGECFGLLGERLIERCCQRGTNTPRGYRALMLFVVGDLQEACFCSFVCPAVLVVFYFLSTLLVSSDASLVIPPAVASFHGSISREFWDPFSIHCNEVHLPPVSISSRVS